MAKNPKKLFDLGKSIVQGIGSLFKGKGTEAAENVSNVFAKNLVDEFGEAEVKEAFRILDDRYKDPNIDNLFFREGESKLDDLVNLLETRYMGSERLQAHALSFNRRGKGAADRYMEINDSGGRLTDLPGGPGDRVLYYKHFGEMSGSKNPYTGEFVYKNKKPTIFTEKAVGPTKSKTIEGEVVDDDLLLDPELYKEGQKAVKDLQKAGVMDETGGIPVGKVTDEKLIQDSLFEKSIADIPIINRMMKETGKSETEIREAIVRRANEGYEPGSAKTMNIFDDDAIRAHVEVQDAAQRSREDFVTDLMEELDEGMSPGMRKILESKGFAKPGEGTATVLSRMEGQAKQMQGASQQIQMMTARAEEMQRLGKFDEANQIMKAVNDYKAQINQMRQGEAFTDDLPILIDPTRKPNAAGGRVGKLKGGIMALLRRINPRLERDMVKTGPFQTGHRADYLGDMQQIKNISRNPKTHLPQMDALYDMVQQSPRYDEAMRGAMMKLIDYERFRAILLDDNDKLQKILKLDPELGEDIIRRLFIMGGREPQFSQGGRVGMFGGGIMNVFRGIGQAAKLADKGIRPFGQKQTYKQTLLKKGISDDQFKIVFKKQLDEVPDEIYDQPTGKAMHTALLNAEAILTGQKLGLLTQTQRSQIAKAMADKVKRQIYDEPVAGLSNEYLEYMDDAIGRMDDIFEIERLGGDLTPKPIVDGKEIIGAQVDFTQLNRLGEQATKTPPYGTKEMSNVIPFKPRDKKSMGGQIGVGSLFRSR